MKMRYALAAALLLAIPARAADTPPPSVVGMMQTLLEATESNDIAQFESVCDDYMKEAMTPTLLQQVNTQLGPLLKSGYTKVYLGHLNRGEFVAYLWKIDANAEGAPDLLATLSVREGKAAGFVLK